MTTEKIVYLLIIIGGVYVLLAEVTKRNPILTRAAVAILPGK